MLYMPPNFTDPGPETHAQRESRIIRARIASARHWRRRRRWLRLRAALFGRRRDRGARGRDSRASRPAFG